MRYLTLLGTELRQVRANVPYVILTIITPVMFMALFVFMIRGDITLPVTAHPDAAQSDFVKVLASNRAPDNPLYFQVSSGTTTAPAGEDTNLIVVRQEPSASDGNVIGEVVHYFNDVNTNMTKNFRNRLTGALFTWSAAHLEGADVTVQERPTYPTDIAWPTAFGMSAVGFGALFSGLLFGLLSMTQEWEQGTALWLRLSTTRPSAVVAAKLGACLVKSAVAGVVLIGFLWLFTEALPTQPLALVGALTLGYLAASAFGLMIGFASRNTLTSFLISLVTALVCWVGGGGLGPMFVFGPTAVTLSQANPATHVIDLVRWAYFGGNYHPGVAFVVLVVTALVGTLGATALYFTRLRRPEVAS